MKKTVIFFANRRYWSEEEKLQNAFEELSRRFADWPETHCLLHTGEGAARMEPDAILIAVPMSGAVQQQLLATAADAAAVILYASYISGNGLAEITAEMARCNAAPTTMDTWSVLRRTHRSAQLALSEAELAEALTIAAAVEKVRHGRIILIGEVEPWVVSAERNPEAYRKYGVEIIRAPQSEVVELFRDASDAEARKYYDHFKSGAAAIIEPTETDLRNAARMTVALLKILTKYRADGMALACFDLLRTGTNACLGVSYINDCTDQFAACEGDLDSAVTMLLLKQLASTKLWIANPGLHPDGVINFSHCTAPLALLGKEQRPYKLRNHHESGIGVSLEVAMPDSATVTACRFSGVTGEMTVQTGKTLPGEPEPVCRTQLYVKLDDFDHYLETALGCHQTFAFEDISRQVKKAAKLLGWKVL